MKKQAKAWVLMMLLLSTMGATAQQLPDTLRLEEARRLAVAAYPLMRQQALHEAITQLQTENLNKNYLPQLAANARASYQSDVTKVPLEMPGVAIPSPDKDMYDFYLSLDQVIWDGGLTRQQKLLQQIDLQISQQQLEVELYKIKEQVNGLYFKILLLQQSRQLLIINQQTVAEKLVEINSGVAHGMLLPTSADVLQAQILQLDQNIAEMDADLRANYSMLGELLQLPLSQNTVLLLPDPPVYTLSFQNQRPEYLLLGMQQNKLQQSRQLTSSAYMPKISATGRAGYGKPGLNMLNNEFDTYYMVGVGARWDIINWNKKNNQLQLLDINSDILQTQKDAFDRSTRVRVIDDISQIEKYSSLIGKDEEIIILRQRITRAAGSQLDNGSITSSDYLDELNRETRANMELELHRIQLSMAKVNYLKTIGAL
jgi:outer membrane protein TolC